MISDIVHPPSPMNKDPYSSTSDEVPIRKRVRIVDGEEQLTKKMKTTSDSTVRDVATAVADSALNIGVMAALDRSERSTLDASVPASTPGSWKIVPAPGVSSPRNSVSLILNPREINCNPLDEEHRETSNVDDASCSGEGTMDNVVAADAAADADTDADHHKDTFSSSTPSSSSSTSSPATAATPGATAKTLELPKTHTQVEESTDDIQSPSTEPHVPILSGSYRVECGIASWEGIWGFDETAFSSGQASKFAFKSRASAGAAMAGSSLRGPVTGLYDGYFNFKVPRTPVTRVYEKGLMLTFTLTTESSAGLGKKTYHVKGTGVNQFGSFTLDGTFEESESILKVTKEYTS